MDGAVKRTLRSLARTRTEADLVALFETVRAYTNAELTAVAFESAPTKPPTLAKDVKGLLQSVVAPPAEKAQLLADALDAGALARKSLPATVAALSKRFGEDAVRSAVRRVLDDMAPYTANEKVK